MSSELLTIIAGTGIKPPGPRPEQFQQIACPSGMNGTWDQSRTCTWNISRQAWECTPWVTTNYGCVPREITFDTNSNYNDPHYNPPYGGRCYWPEGGESKDYGQTIKFIVPSGGYTMTLDHRIECVFAGVGNTGMWSDLTISIPGAPSGATVSVYWDRDYASFPSKVLDSTGKAHWRVINHEFVKNGTRFIVRMT